MNRRSFTASTLAGLAASASALLTPRRAVAFEVTRTEAEWKAMLTDLQYRVMREEGTERAYSSPLNDNKAAGVYLCRGCDLAVYSSDHKFDSGTGWPSFYKALPGAVETKRDFKLIMPRTECHCRRCGSHLGHVFNDGPQPTGKRHCINGVSLKFAAA